MPRVLTIGTFDGVHAGHRALVGRAREIAANEPRASASGSPCLQSNGEVVALVFDPHPATVLRPDAVPERLTTFARRADLLKQAGADTVVRLEPTLQLLDMSAEEFVADLAVRYNPAALVEGPDFRFGKNRRGDADLLSRLGAQHGFACEVLPPIEVALTDHTLVRASSTMVRWFLKHGRVRDAAIVLGRPYEVDGMVVRGDRRGRRIGFPTANIDTECLVPADGVYAGIAELPNGTHLAAGIHVGPRSTFGDTRRTIEAHLLAAEVDEDAAGPEPTRRLRGLPEYGWPIRLQLVAWLRDQMKFESVESLVDQMTRDCERAATLAAGIKERTPMPEEMSV